MGEVVAGLGEAGWVLALALALAPLCTWCFTLVLAGGVAEPAGGDVTAVDVEALVAPAVGAAVEEVGVVADEDEPDGDEPDAEGWAAASLAAELTGAGEPCNRSAAPTATTTRPTAVAPRMARARLSGSGASPTNHNSHCLKLCVQLFNRSAPSSTLRHPRDGLRFPLHPALGGWLE